jgi:hypothetical protein
MKKIFFIFPLLMVLVRLLLSFNVPHSQYRDTDHALGLNYDPRPRGPHLPSPDGLLFRNVPGAASIPCA